MNLSNKSPHLSQQLAVYNFGGVTGNIVMRFVAVVTTSSNVIAVLLQMSRRREFD